MTGDGTLERGWIERTGLDTVAVTNKVEWTPRDARAAEKCWRSDRNVRYLVKDEYTELDFSVSLVPGLCSGRANRNFWARTEVSLPKYLTGRNTEPASIEDFRCWLKMLDSSKRIRPILPWTQANLTRVDLVRDVFRGDADDWIRRVSTMPAPFRRMTAARYDGTAFWYNGSHALRVYDKHRESGDPDSLGQCRIEYQIRKHRLAYYDLHYASDLSDVVILTILEGLAATVTETGDTISGTDPVANYNRLRQKGCSQRDAMLIMAANLLEDAGIPIESRRIRERMKGQADAGKR